VVGGQWPEEFTSLVILSGALRREGPMQSQAASMPQTIAQVLRFAQDNKEFFGGDEPTLITSH
jgi:hypothetical protein